jgi:pyruvate formate lyase activating enzyme
VCMWCHNPEGLDLKPELIHYQNRCLACLECMSVCAPKAISRINDTITVNYDSCDLCLKCVQVCHSQAMDIVGREVTVADVMAEIERDMIFYEQSGGGVTFSGGEPLTQPKFLYALLLACKKKHIRTALDTCGYAPYEVIEKVSEYVDVFLYDLKTIDNDKHKEYILKDNKLILANLERLAKQKKQIIIRIPVIPGINDDTQLLQKTAQYLKSLNTIQDISLLPYHQAADEKYKRLKKSNRMKKTNSPSDEKVKSVKAILEKYGFTVKIGG